MRDKALDGLVEFAALRGSNYVKGDVSIEEMKLKTAELGVLLLMYVKKMNGSGESGLRERIKELQPYIDDFRKCLFDNKFKKH
ncbi:MAG: hypothetical protein M0Z59_01710 [Nitrospiraceae bacterium]|nr:hypothetical protein [Nitrospiraceae bacterium]